MKPCEVALLCVLLCLSLCRQSASWATTVRTQRLFPRRIAYAAEDPYSSLLDLAQPVDKELASVLMAEAALGSPTLAANFGESDPRAECEFTSTQDDTVWVRGAGLPKLTAPFSAASLEADFQSKAKKRIEIPAVVKEFIIATAFDRSVTDEQVKTETSWRYAAMETRAWLKALRKRKGRHMLPSIKAHFAKTWLLQEPWATRRSPPAVVMDEQADFFLPKPKPTRLDYLQPKLPVGRPMPGNPVICQLSSLKEWSRPVDSVDGARSSKTDLPIRDERFEGAAPPIRADDNRFHVEESLMPIATHFHCRVGNCESEYYVIL